MTLAKLYQLVYIMHMQDVEGQDWISPEAPAAAHDDPSADTFEEAAPAPQSEQLSHGTINAPEEVAAADGSEASAAAQEEDAGGPDGAGVSSPADGEPLQERPEQEEGNPTFPTHALPQEPVEAHYACCHGPGFIHQRPAHTSW